MAVALSSKDDRLPPSHVPVVLLVEDDDDDFFLLQRAFRDTGLRATLERAKDGLEGKEFLEKAILTGAVPDCIILDLRMPRLDGFGLLEYMRSRPALHNVPAHVLTTSSNPTDMARAYRLGARGYLVKPSSFELLVQMALTLQQQWSPTTPRRGGG